MPKKILIITGDAGESYEALYALHRFEEADYEPIVAAPNKRPLHLVIHDFEEGWDTYIEKPGYNLESDLTFEEVNVDEYLAVLILGGRAPEYLRHDSCVLDIVREFERKGKWVFAVCHGIQILISAGLAKDRCMTAYEHVRFEVEAAGGKYSKREAVRDGKFVTAQNWGSHPDFYREIFSCLNEVGS